MIDLPKLLRLLAQGDVAFVIVGGVAGVIHGSSRLTQDLDVVYDRNPKNLSRLLKALADQKPYLRGAPPGLPFEWTESTLEMGLNFKLQTDAGPLDLLGEIAGVSTYEDLLEQTIEVELFGLMCRCIDLPALIRTKRAAGRPRDLEAAAELEAIREEQNSDNQTGQDRDAP